MWRLKGHVPRQPGETLKSEDLMELASGRREPTGFERRVRIKGSFSAEALQGFSMESIVGLDLEEPALNTLDILEVFPNIEALYISTTSGSVLLAWTQRVLAVFPQPLKPWIRLFCESCVLSKDEEAEMLANLREILPGSAQVFLKLPKSLRREVALHLLPLCRSLSKLTIEVPDFDCVVPWLESGAYLTLRELWCTTSSLWTDEQAHFFAQKILANRYLRVLSCWTQSPEANMIILASAAEIPSVLQVSCYYWKIESISPELMERIRTCHGLHPRMFYIGGIKESVWLDLFAEFPNQFLVPKLSSPNKAVLKRIQKQLESPTCALRELIIDVEKSRLNRESLLSFAGTVSRCRSLIRVHLSGLTDLPWVASIIVLLKDAVFLKSLFWDPIEVDRDHIVALAGAMATNEVLEYVSNHEMLRSLADAVRFRNVAMCVRRCRLLLLSWLSGYQRHGNTLFDAAVVFEILVSSELD